MNFDNHISDLMPNLMIVFKVSKCLSYNIQHIPIVLSKNNIQARRKCQNLYSILDQFNKVFKNLIHIHVARVSEYTFYPLPTLPVRNTLTSVFQQHLNTNLLHPGGELFQAALQQLQKLCSDLSRVQSCSVSGSQ